MVSQKLGEIGVKKVGVSEFDQPNMAIFTVPVLESIEATCYQII
jgi:hypothetical protein